MTLLEKQKLFAALLVKLFQFILDSGFEFTLGEAWRPGGIAVSYAKAGIGIENSLHRCRLAIDLNLFLGNRYLTLTDEYKVIGEYWESLSGAGYQCFWGGRFQDGNHFSIGYNGIK